MQDDLKIDVGEADEQETEIDLDAAPQEEQPEEKPEIEIAEAPGTTHAETEEVKTNVEFSVYDLATEESSPLNGETRSQTDENIRKFS